MMCEYDCIHLDAQTPLALLEFRYSTANCTTNDHTDRHDSPHRVRTKRPHISAWRIAALWPTMRRRRSSGLLH